MFRLFLRELWRGIVERIKSASLIHVILLIIVINYILLGGEGYDKSLVVLGALASFTVLQILYNKQKSEEDKKELEQIKARVDALVLQKSVKQPMEGKRFF